MKMKKLLIISIALICFSCDYNQEKNEFPKTQIKEEISIMMRNFVDDLNKSGVNSQIKYLDNSEDFRWTYSNERKIYQFNDLVKKFNNSKIEDYDVHLSFDELQIIPISENIANYNLKLSGYTKNEGKNTDISILESGTLIKRNDEWKFLNMQTATYDKIL